MLCLSDPPALGYNDTHDPQNVDPKEWPCVGPSTPFIFPQGACAVCSEAHPCLFVSRLIHMLHLFVPS